MHGKIKRDNHTGSLQYSISNYQLNSWNFGIVPSSNRTIISKRLKLAEEMMKLANVRVYGKINEICEAQSGKQIDEIN